MTRGTHGTQKKGGVWCGGGVEASHTQSSAAEHRRKPAALFDEDRRRKFLSALRLGYSVAHAAIFAGLHARQPIATVRRIQISQRRGMPP